MAINLPNVRNITLPEVPKDITDLKALREYLWKTKQILELVHVGAFDNVSSVQSVINTGTTGTIIVGTSTLNIENGIITSIS